MSKTLVNCLFFLIFNGVSQLAGQEFKGELSQWEIHRLSEVRASFMMPKNPVYLEGDVTFIFSYLDLHAQPANRQATNKALQEVVRGNVFNVLGNLLPAEEVGMTQKPLSISLDGSSGLQYVYRFARNKEPFTVTSRVFSVGQRIYQLNCIMIEKNYDLFVPANFLKTIKLDAPDNDLSPRPRKQAS